MKKIITHSQDDAELFDLNRFEKSLNRFAKISKSDIEEALKNFEQYETMHISCLVEIGVVLIEKAKDQATAKKYFAENAEYFEEGNFERLRRITGYLVGTLERWNDGKKAEERVRVKHTVDVAKA